MRHRRARARLVLGAVLLLCAAAAAPRASAADESGLASIPDYQGYVTDRAGVIGEQRHAQLESFLASLKEKTGVQFAVLTVPTCAPEDPGTYKTHVFQHWAIGNKERNDGLLLLVAMQEKKLVFETGYGLEGTLPDGWEARMLRDLAIPRFRSGEPAEGITAAVLSAAQRIAAEKGVTLMWDGAELRYNGNRGRGGYPPNWVIALALAFFLLRIASVARSGRRGIWYGGGWGGGFGGMGGGFGGGGGGGGSFGGFGGGGSGGGGGGAGW